CYRDWSSDVCSSDLPACTARPFARSSNATQATLALRRVRGTSKRMRGARGVLFNTSQLVIAAALGGLVYHAFLPHHGPAPLGRFENLWALPAAATTMQLTNTASVTLMVGLQLRRSPRQILHLMRQPPGLERVGLFL